jgi:hypothetical protein
LKGTHPFLFFFFPVKVLSEYLVLEIERILTQQVGSPPGKQNRQQPILSQKEPSFPKRWFLSLLALLGLILLIFTALLLQSAPQAFNSPSTATPGQAEDTSFMLPGGTAANSPLPLPAGRSIIYEQQNKIYLVASTGGKPRLLETPGYVYNRAVAPQLTANGELL